MIAVLAIVKHLTQPVFKITHTQCRLDNQACPSDLETTIANLHGQSFFFSQLENEVQNQTTQFYQLQTVTKTWPNQVQAEFSLKTANYLLSTNSQERYVVAETGYAQLNANPPDLLEIKNLFYPQAVTDHQVEPELHQLATRLISASNTHQLKLQQVVIYQPDHTRLLINSHLQALVQESDLETQIAKLSVILTELDLNTIDLQIAEIDLRFELPVLRTSQTPPP